MSKTAGGATGEFGNSLCTCSAFIIVLCLFNFLLLLDAADLLLVRSSRGESFVGGVGGASSEAAAAEEEGVRGDGDEDE